MNAIKILLAFVFLAIGAEELTAQYRYRYLRVGISGGATNYLGDLDDDEPWKFTKPGVGINATYRFNALLWGRVSFFQGWMGADDAESNDFYRRQRNLNFRSQIQEFSAQLVVDFAPSYRSYRYRPKVTPYIFGGIALFNYNPQGRLGDVWYDLHTIGTEGQYLGPPYPEPYSLTQYAIPMGFGLRFAVGNKVDLEIESGVRKTFTDYLDDVSSAYPDLDEMQDRFGPVAATLADPSDRTVFPDGIRAIRGDATQSDWYIYTNISLNVILDWNRCPVHRR